MSAAPWQVGPASTMSESGRRGTAASRSMTLAAASVHSVVASGSRGKSLQPERRLLGR